MLAAAQSANLALRFLLEVALLACVAVAAWRTGRTPVARWTRLVRRSVTTSALAAVAVGNIVLLAVRNQ